MVTSVGVLALLLALHTRTVQDARLDRALPAAVATPVWLPTPVGRRTNIDVTDSPGPQNEVSIAIPRDDPYLVVVAAHDYRSNFKHIGVWTSRDGGATFTGGEVSGLGIHGFEGDPALAAHRRGLIYLAYIDHSTTSGNRIAVARSTDGGFTWPSATSVVNHSTTDEGFEDKPYLAVDDTGGAFDGNVYVAWVRIGESNVRRIRFARSIDKGRTFELTFLTPRIPNSGITGPVPVVGVDGEVYVAWSGTSNAIHFARSVDGGITFTDPIHVVTQAMLPNPLPGAVFRTNPFPTLAVDRSFGPARGTLYVAWADRLGTGLGPDVLLVRSTDGGDTWSAPIRVSDDPFPAYQFFPWMCVGPDGAVNLVFHDQRNAPGTTRYDTYLARSLDGGLSFEPNLLLSDEISDTALDPSFLGTFIGDYNGIAASPLGVYPVWTDIRASEGQQEVYLRRVRFPGP